MFISQRIAPTMNILLYYCNSCNNRLYVEQQGYSTFHVNLVDLVDIQTDSEKFTHGLFLAGKQPSN